MKAVRNGFVFLIAIHLLIACDEETPAKAFQPRFKELPKCKNGICIEPLVIPDSIDKSLVAVTYYEDSPRIGHSLIVYDDSLRQSATCIKYYADSGIFQDRLKVMAYNVFRSIADTCAGYTIKDSTVAFVHDKHSMILNWEYKRTDNLPPPSLLKE
jgi:hypothetical protein